MDPVIWQARPSEPLRAPVLLAAWQGWNDAGEAASNAVSFLAEAYDAQDVARIDPEEFHDFTETRPTVRLTDDLARVIDWPEAVFQLARVPHHPHDLVFLHAHEPQMRWRTYCATVIGVARELGCAMVVTIGSLLGDVPHTRPTPITGVAHDPLLAARLGLVRSRYEGPTGIVGVVHEALAHNDLPSASLWASVPHYVSATPSPVATLALVNRVSQLLGLSPNVDDLVEASAEYRHEIDDVVDGDSDAEDYVRQLEARADDDDDGEGRPDDDEPLRFAAADELATEAERFLRDQGGRSR